MEIGLVTAPRLKANLMFLAISPTLDTRNLDREPSVHFLSLLGSCSRRSPDDCQPFRTAKLSRISNAGAVMIENPTKTDLKPVPTSNTSTMGTVSASGTSLWPHRSRRSSHIPDVPTFSSLAASHTPQWANVS
ncbi:uncharacterized protein CLUP02_02042 [Colletotrichum lupini]|uniref:Uncharacterized protein n=1 Tax=Colletotrichum lupini TaxID=145971 RepID=A0A9Q8SE50_9PEZI|nr:uncharacterized protein CLUP02_02042 [Colletotrichum lupini]UQC75388.1 hypothetical protein CLUP02_02042 [Colletotrichum lupini]